MDNIRKILDFIAKNRSSKWGSSSDMIDYLVGALSEKELNELMPLLEKETCGLSYQTRSEVNRCLNKYYYKRQCEEDCLKRNESVKTLLSLYNDKRSGRVQEARKKLHKRFMHLTYKEQCLCMRTFLDGGKTDRDWCYGTLRKWWTEELRDDIIRVWNTYHDEHCGWLFPRYMSVDVIKEHIDSLLYDSNYLAMCNRLIDEDWFEIDKVRLLKLTDECRYLWIMSRTKDMLTIDEALEQLYRWIARCIIKYDYETYTDEIFQRWRYEEPMVELKNGFYVESRLFMKEATSVDKVLTSLCRMQMYDEVESFLSLDYEIHDSFVKSYEKDILDAEKFSALKNSEVVEAIYMKFVQYYAQHLPRKYQYCLKQVDPMRIKENAVSNEVATLPSLSQEEINEMCSAPSMEFLMDKLDLEVDEDQNPF